MSAKKTDKQSETIVIKRYASRRLYNSDISEYVTLDEIAKLIREGRDVKIIDKKTGEDLTRQYLLQIISDQEANGDKAFPVRILTEVIRGYQDKTQNMMPDFLDKSYGIFKEQQAVFLQQQKELMEKTSPQKPAATSFMDSDVLKAWQKQMGSWLGNSSAAPMGTAQMNASSIPVTEPLKASMDAAAKAAKNNPAMPGFDMAALQKQQQAFFDATIGQMIPKKKAAEGEEDDIAKMKRELAELTEKLKNL